MLNLDFESMERQAQSVDAAAERMELVVDLGEVSELDLYQWLMADDKGIQ